VFQFNPQQLNTIKMLYKIQVESENDSGIYYDITKVLVQDIELGNNRFLIDPSQICNDYVVTTLTPVNKGVMHKPNNIRSYRFIFTGAQFNNDGTLNYSENHEEWQQGYRFYGIDAATQHEQTFFKAQHQWLENNWTYGGNNQADIKLHPSSNIPFETFKCEDEHAYLDYGFYSTGTHRFKFKFFLLNGSTQLFEMDYMINPRDLYSVPIGIPELYAMVDDNGSNPATYGLSLTNNQVASMELSIFRVAGNGNEINLTPSISRRFNYKNCECNNRGITVYWKNRKGGVDSFKFLGDFEEKLNTSYSTFQRALGFRRMEHEDTNHYAFTKENNTFSQMSLGRGKINIEGNMKFTVYSRHLPKEILTWLSEIYTSPRVWVQSDKFTGIFYSGEARVDNARNWQSRQAIIVTTGEVITNPKKRDVGQIKLEFVRSNDLVTQRQ
jgi:hypothetical protein